MKLSVLSRLWKVLRNAVAVVCGLVIVIALLPSKARSQLGLDPCCAMMQVGLNTISGLLRNSVAMPLGSIQQSQQQSANFEQQVVFPMAAITQARNMALQFEGQFVQMRQLFQLPVASATLPMSQMLEQSLLSGNPGAMPQITSNYSALYGTVMPPANAPQPVRNMVDMTDAEAQAAMKKAVEIDALANLELQAAEQINRQLQSAARCFFCWPAGPFNRASPPSGVSGANRHEHLHYRRNRAETRFTGKEDTSKAGRPRAGVPIQLELNEAK